MVTAIVLYPFYKTVAYVRTPTINGVPFIWNLVDPSEQAKPIISESKITYNLNPAGSDNLTFDQTAQALASSFQSWEDITTSTVAFKRGPDTTIASTGTDNIYQVFWVEDSTTTSDGLDISGALAVTRLTTYVGGTREGEIVDASTVFNGNQYTWAMDGRLDAMDIQEVATHEIGHAIGLSHSPIGGATMFPRTGEGRTDSRTLASDDIIAASVMYPESGFVESTGTVSGTIRDNSGNTLFGAHIVILNSSGNVITGTLSQRDGSYLIAGLPPGNYSLYTEPLRSDESAFYSLNDLTSFYTKIDTNFLTTREYKFSIDANKNLRGDIYVSRGTPSLSAHYISDQVGDTFFNIPSIVKQGQNKVIIGVSGPGVPSSGAPLSISGKDISVQRTFFKTLSNGMTAVMAEVNISPDAVPGQRNIIISNGSERTVITGGVTIQAAFPATIQEAVAPETFILSTANFLPNIALESIATVYGKNMATEPISGTSASLPTMLGSTTVIFKDVNDVEKAAPLYFVSPGQINLHIPPGLSAGPATMTVNNGNTVVSTTKLTLELTAPGLFSSDGTGKGYAYGNVVRVIANTIISNQPVAQFNQSTNAFDPVPVNFRSKRDRIILVVAGTGFKYHSGLTATVGGKTMPVEYLGKTQEIPGLDQAGIQLDPSLKGSGNVDVILSTGDKKSNAVTIYIK